jgi:hypothetical protein
MEYGAWTHPTDSQAGCIRDTCTTKQSWSSSLTIVNGRPIKALVLGCVDGAWERDTAVSLGLYTPVFQSEIYAIKACVMENIEKGYTGRNMYHLSDSQSTIKALNSFHINFKLFWDCHQSLVKLAEHNRIQLVWVPGHMGNWWKWDNW